MSSSQSGEGEIRQAIVEADLVDCMVALPGQLFYTTQIPVCLWFLDARQARAENGLPRSARARRSSSTRASWAAWSTGVHRELTTEDIARIARDVPRLARRRRARRVRGRARLLQGATLERSRGHGYVLTPGRYVGAEEVEDDGEPFEAKMQRLTATLASSSRRARGWSSASG